jgi:hypothetical protein
MAIKAQQSLVLRTVVAELHINALCRKQKHFKICLTQGKKQLITVSQQWQV